MCKSQARRFLRHRSPIDGFTLLEVLVAIVVLSFGVLGVVGLQAAALQSNKEARYQAAAARLGRELADLMRGNKYVAILTNPAGNPYLLDEYLGGAPILPDATANCFNAACTTTVAVATAQLNEWLSRVNEELPGVRVRICFDSAPYAADGTPQWGCTAGGGVVVLKLGWTRRDTNKDAAPVSGASGRPMVIMPVIAGS